MADDVVHVVVDVKVEVVVVVTFNMVNVVKEIEPVLIRNLLSGSTADVLAMATKTNRQAPISKRILKMLKEEISRLVTAADGGSSLNGCLFMLNRVTNLSFHVDNLIPFGF